jgi:uncharacterized protein (DUF2267 family)
MLIRGIYYEGWTPTGKPVKERHREEFLKHIQQHFKGNDEINPEIPAHAVFSLLAKRIASGEIEDVKHIFAARDTRSLAMRSMR